MFTVYNAALFKSLPFENPGSIVLQVLPKLGLSYLRDTTLEERSHVD